MYEIPLCTPETRRLWSSSEAERILHRKKTSKLVFLLFSSRFNLVRTRFSLWNEIELRVNKQIYTFFWSIETITEKKEFNKFSRVEKNWEIVWRFSFSLIFFVEFFSGLTIAAQQVLCREKNLCLNDFNAKWKLSDVEGKFSDFHHHSRRLWMRWVGGRWQDLKKGSGRRDGIHFDFHCATAMEWFIEWKSAAPSADIVVL